MHARQCGLFGAYITTDDVPISEIEVHLSHMVDQGYTVSPLKPAQNACWHLLECMTIENVRTLVTNTASPSQAWRALNDHFFPLTDA